jgi:predicted negative regulator of RcsB-dependent stress response
MEAETVEATQTVATVGTEPSLGSELAMVKDLTGGNPVVTIILAAILMVGGPAGWKFWTARQKAKTELEEKRMELEAKIKLAEIKAADNDDEPKKGKKSKKS